MLQNAYFLAKIGADTAENERKFAEILPKNGNYPTGPLRGPPRALEDDLARRRRGGTRLRGIEFILSLLHVISNLLLSN